MDCQKTFKLVRPTLALDVVDGKQRAVTIPADAIVTVCGDEPDRSGLLKVSWDERSLRMFAVDLSARAIDATGGSERPSQSERPPSSTSFGEESG